MFKVIDLFAGPGGLAEGFSAVRDDMSQRVFEVALSIEKERSAFKTLRLRSFVRQFGDDLPHAYYEYIAGDISHDDLTSLFPGQWAEACRETLRVELGADGSEAIVDAQLDRIMAAARDNIVLVGGPPCQAYSTVGRARNRGIANYVASEDHRHFLYREYIRILAKVRPIAFVMENVKGILSARVDGQGIFDVVMADLRSAGSEADDYIILPLARRSGQNGAEHLIEAELYGIPQARHRVILFGMRKDVAARIIDPDRLSPRLEPVPAPTVRDLLYGMPPIRSRLSRTADSPEQWRSAVALAFRGAAMASFEDEDEDEQLDGICPTLMKYASVIERETAAPSASSKLPAPIRNNHLADWLVDPRLTSLSNHEARGHMQADLARYAFASVFSEVLGRSPKASDFPAALAPNHQSWTSGHFKDRFRVQCWDVPATTVTSHIAKDGHYFIHPDPMQCRSLSVREAARLQTFPDNYFFEGNRTEQYVQVGNAVPPLLAYRIAEVVRAMLA